ncbi:MAG: SGNH/GDSL hydrolase family protein [Clostridia bacterium]|nr:SGNH/GDSL hydrolase family protein [Clostridia bacterium]
MKKRDENGNKEYHDMFEYSWGQYIARKNGLKAYNFSRGGMSTTGYIENFAEEKGYWDKEKACQAYVIAMGYNDIYNGTREIGTIDDISDDWKNNKKTFIGNYATIISRYKEISPDSKFFLVTLCDDAIDDATKKERVKGMVDALYSLGDYFDNCYVIDLYHYGPIHNEKFREKFYLYGHMTPSGYILTARIIDSYIDYIIRHNPKDFKNVGFIGRTD